MTLDSRLIAVVNTIAIAVKNNQVKTWDLTTLSTTQKDTIVQAINELKNLITQEWADRASAINTAIANALEGEDLSDLADAVAGLAQTDNGLVSAVVSQAFSEAQKIQARANIGWASQEDLDTLTTNVGNTEQDLVAVFNATYNA